MSLWGYSEDAFAELVGKGREPGNIADGIQGGVLDFIRPLLQRRDTALDVEQVRSPDGIPSIRTATDEHYKLPYERLLASAEPVNWSVIMPRKFTRMVPMGLDDNGWERVVEHGRLGLLTHRTPLKFFKSLTKDGGYRIDYDLDDTCDPTVCDSAVTADIGYIKVLPEGDGVRVRTVKVWAIAGMIPALASFITPWLGWAALTEEFFTSAARVRDYAPFQISEVPT